MRTIEKTVYKFEELPEEAKQKVLEDWINFVNEADFLRDDSKSFEKFCEVFNVQWKNYGVDTRTIYQQSFDYDHEILNFSGIRLIKYVWNNYKDSLYSGKYYSKWQGLKLISRKSMILLDNCCPLTGYCMDNEILKPVYGVLDGKQVNNSNYTYQDMIADCVKAFEKYFSINYNFYCGAEYCAEDSELNNYEYYENGEMI